MARIIFVPKTNSQRGAVARFGTDWQLAEGFIFGFPVRGVPCAFIHPVGRLGEGRWVNIQQIARGEG